MTDVGNLKDEALMAFRITSRAFKEGGDIPTHYTADGENISPPIEWLDAPAGAKSFALIMHDPDAPGGDFSHWLVYNIPPTVILLPEAFPSMKALPNGIRQGVNDFGSIGYQGPDPPSGIHRYFFKIYALTAALDLEDGVKRPQLEKSIQRRIVDQAEMMGQYERK